MCFCNWICEESTVSNPVKQKDDHYTIMHSISSVRATFYSLEELVRDI